MSHPAAGMGSEKYTVRQLHSCTKRESNYTNPEEIVYHTTIYRLYGITYWDYHYLYGPELTETHDCIL